jgi:hypothetical protein
MGTYKVHINGSISCRCINIVNMGIHVVTLLLALLKTASSVTVGLLATIGVLAILTVVSFNAFIGSKKTSAFDPKDMSIQHGGSYNLSSYLSLTVCLPSFVTIYQANHSVSCQTHTVSFASLPNTAQEGPKV